MQRLIWKVCFRLSQRIEDLVSPSSPAGRRFSLTRMIPVRMIRRMEARNPINPGPGFRKSPIPTLRLDAKITTEKLIRRRALMGPKPLHISPPFRDALSDSVQNQETAEG